MVMNLIVCVLSAATGFLIGGFYWMHKYEPVE